MQNETTSHVSSTPWRAVLGMAFGIVNAAWALSACAGQPETRASSSDVVGVSLVQAGAPATVEAHGDDGAPAHHGKKKHHHHPCPAGDDPSTPGDDRPNHVQCGAALSCGPDTGGCCSFESECGPLGGQCPSGGPMFTCDGPEDCTSPGERCFGGMVAPMCATNGPFLKCHTAQDCSLPSRPVCSDSGSCVES